MDREAEAREILKKGIIKIAAELEMDEIFVEKCIESLPKAALIDKFCELKELRLKQENARLVEFLIV